MNKTLLAASLALAAFCPTSAEAGLPPGISGSWFNPNQPGHGLSIEILRSDLALAYWYVFDAEGRPVHLYIEGDIVGQRIEGTAYLGRGMRFNSFNPSQLDLARWGTVTLDFSACNQATLSWNPDGPGANGGFQPGTMQVNRLAGVAGLPCDLGSDALVPSGLIEGRLSSTEPGFDSRYPEGMDVYAAIDESGRFWGVAGDHLVGDNSGGFWPYSSVLVGEVDDVQPALVRLDLEALQNSGWPSEFRTQFEPSAKVPLHVPLASGRRSGLAGVGYGEADAQVDVRLNSAGAGAELLETESLADLAGSYRFQSYEQFFQPEVTVEVAADGSVCLVDLVDESRCDISGQISLSAEGEAGAFFEVTLFPTARPDRPAIGRGWRIGGDEPALVLVTARDDQGLGLVLRRAD